MVLVRGRLSPTPQIIQAAVDCSVAELVYP